MLVEVVIAHALTRHRAFGQLDAPVSHCRNPGANDEKRPEDRAATVPEPAHGASLAQRTDRLIALLVALDAIGISLAGIARYRAGLTHFYDLGVYDNVIWQAAHGRFFYYPQYEMSFFGDHFAPLLFLFVPLYWLFAHPCLLVILQSVALSMGAIPLARATRAILAQAGGSDGPLGSEHFREAVGIVLVLLYFANVALLHISMFDFHPLAFAIPLSLAMYQAALAGRWPRFWLTSALLLACKEESAISVASFGLVLVLFGEDRSRRRHGAVLALAAAVYFVVVMTLIIPAFQRPAAQAGWVYVTRYAHLGATLGEVLRTIALHPLHTLAVSFAPYKLETLFQLVLPLGLLPLIGWRTLLVALPSLFYGYISARNEQFRIQYQYFSVTLPWLFISASWGLQAWGRACTRLTQRWSQRRWLAMALCAAPLLLAADSSLYYLVKLKPIRSEFFAVWPHWRAIEEVRAIIGPDASVSATNSLAPFFSHRPEIYLSLDFIHNRDLVRVLGLPDYHDSRFHLFDVSDLSGSRDREKRILELLHDSDYGLRYLNLPIVLFEKGYRHADSPLLENAFPHERLLPDGSRATAYSTRELLRNDPHAVIVRKDERGADTLFEMLPGARGVIYGPYLTLEPGRYRALFNLALGQASNPSTRRAPVIDVATGLGTNVLVSAALDASQLAGEASDLPLDFTLGTETLDVEFRTHSNRNGLILRRVTLLRLDPPP